METEGPHSDTGTTKGSPDSNVVRFPRDWLGPREELVPFGSTEPSRGAESSGTSEPSGGGEQSRGGEQSGVSAGAATPPTAADFWSEEAVVLHDALQAPLAPVAEPSRVGVPAEGAGARRGEGSDASHGERRIRRGKRFDVMRKWTRRTSYSTADGRTTGDRSEGGSSAKTRRFGPVSGIRSTPMRVVSALGATLAITALAAVVMTHSSRPPVASRPPQIAGSHMTTLATLVSRTEDDFSSVRRIALHRWPKPSTHRPAKRVTHHHTVVTPQPASVVSEGPLPSTSTPVPATSTTVQSTSSSSGHPATVASAAPSQPVSSQPVSSPPPSVAASGTSSSSSGSSSPSSQPAFGANGTLGPGHSSTNG